MVDISIIIPIFNEKKYIEECINSIINSKIDKKYEILLIDGGSTDGTLEKIKTYQIKFPFIKIINNPQKIAPIAMNIGIKNSTGKFIFIISAHAIYPKNYFTELIKYIQTLNADCVGPVLITEVKNKNKISIAIKNVLSDKLGVGSAFRSGVNKIKEVDTVPFGCYKKEVFDKVGLFDERLVRNQDIEFNKRLKQAGGKIFLIPDIKCTYYARETYKDLAKNNFQNGLWNILTAYYTKSLKSLSIRHYIPLLFILTLFSLLFIKPIYSLILFLIYLSIITIRSLMIKRDTTIFHQILAFLILHFSYGFGEILGIIQVLKKKLIDFFQKLN